MPISICAYMYSTHCIVPTDLHLYITSRYMYIANTITYIYLHSLTCIFILSPSSIYVAILVDNLTVVAILTFVLSNRVLYYTVM